MREHVRVRLPGSDSALAADEFDPGEVAGMRSAALILLVTAGVTVALWAVTRQGLPIAAAIDVFLGVQLLRLRHSWRAWAMLRAGVGLVVGGFALLAALFGGLSPALALVVFGNIAYCGSLLLLLFGSPTRPRVLAGRATFGIAVVLFVAAFVLLVAGAELLPETDLQIDVR